MPVRKNDVVAEQAVPPGQGVGGDRRVGVADVGRVVDVVDRRGDVEAAHDAEHYRRSAIPRREFAAGHPARGSGGHGPHPSTGRRRAGRGGCAGRRPGRAGARAPGAAGAGQVLEAPLRGLEPAAHQVDRLGELAPTARRRRPGTAGSRRTVRSSVNGVDRLADDGQHREQGERRAEHDLLAQGDVDQPGIVLVDERVDALVGDEQQHVVDRGVGVDVARGRDSSLSAGGRRGGTPARGRALGVRWTASRARR